MTRWVPAETYTDAAAHHALLATRWADSAAAKGRDHPDTQDLRRQMIALRTPLNPVAARELAILRHEEEAPERARNISIAPAEQRLPAVQKKRREPPSIVVSHARDKQAPKPVVCKPKAEKPTAVYGTVEDPLFNEIVEMYASTSLVNIAGALRIGTSRVHDVVKASGVTMRAIGKPIKKARPSPPLDLSDLRRMREIGFNGEDCARLLRRDRKKLAKAIRDLDGGDPFTIPLLKLRTLQSQGLTEGQIGVATGLTQSEVEMRMRDAAAIEVKYG